MTEENRSLFENMAPEEFFDPLDKLGHFVLGAVGEDEKGPYAAGVLCFQIKLGSDGEDNLVAGVLQWLYVGSEFRGRGAADTLMTEFFSLLASAGIEMALCDVPFGFEYNDFSVYLQQWGFEFELMDIDEVRVSLKRLTAIPQIWGKASPFVLPLHKAPEKLQEQALNIALRLHNIAPDLEECISRCDRDLSCILIKEKKPVGMAVACPVAENILELAFLRTFPYDGRNMLDLIHFVSAQARKKYSPDTEIRYTIRTETVLKITKSILPKLQPLLVYRGVCPTMEET